MISAFVLYYGAQLSCPNVSQLLGGQRAKDASKNSLFDCYSRTETFIWPTYWQRFFEVDTSRGPYADRYILLAIILKLGYERALTLNGLSVNDGAY